MSKKINKKENTFTAGKLLKDFAVFYKPHKKLFILDIICAFLIAVCNLFYPFITKNVLNIYIPNQQLKLMIVWLAVLLCIYVIKAILQYIVEYYGHIVGVRIQGDMRKKLFAHLQRLPFSYYDENKTGTIMSRMINDLFEISELAHHGPEDIFISVITIIGALVLLLFIHPLLTLILAVILPIIITYAVFSRKTMLAAFKKMREKTGEINANIESAVAGIRVSKAYTAEKHQKELFNQYNLDFQDARGFAYLKMAKFHSTMMFFIDFLYFLAILAGGLFVYYKLISIGDFTAFILYIVILINPIRTFMAIFEQIQAGLSGFLRYEELLAIQPEVENENAVNFTATDGNISFEKVSFAYKNGENETYSVINDLSLNIPAGKTLALVGPSGGGKTTLCHLIPRFYEIDSGSITIDGVNISDMSRESLRKNVGIVAQDVFLFAGTIKDNIAYGDFTATDDEIIEAAKLANIYDYITSLPDGFNTYVGERGIKLSGGQKQRISIARAFLKNPKILILDEATSALDNVTEYQIQESLDKLSNGRTTIVVAHRLSTVKNADEIVVITKDGIVEHGPHEKLIDNNGIYAKLYNEQFRQ